MGGNVAVLCALVAALLLLVVAVALESGGGRWPAFRRRRPAPPPGPGSPSGPPRRSLCAPAGGAPSPPSAKPKAPKTDPLFQYLAAVFPAANTPAGLWTLTSAQLRQLYSSLSWYYLPLAGPIAPERRNGGADWAGWYPIAGPWASAETQFFVGDGSDCGVAAPPGEFSCSIYNPDCETWEFGGPGVEAPKAPGGWAPGGRPYQAITFIRPYGCRGGNPNNSWIECVAYVCEALGRQLLNAGAPGQRGCAADAPTWPEFLGNPQAGAKANWPREGFSGRREAFGDPPCMTPQGRPIPKACAWPEVCQAVYEKGEVYGNYCSAPCGWEGCDVARPYAQGGCDWFVGGVPWLTWLRRRPRPETEAGGWAFVDQLLTARPAVGADPFVAAPGAATPVAGAAPAGMPKPRHDGSVSKTMFYWIPGYGKWLNMGKTGVYSCYQHFLLTAPKEGGRRYNYRTRSWDKGVPVRMSYPQVMAMTMSAGERSWGWQLIDLMSARNADPRPRLEGYVTTLRDSYKAGFEGQGGVPVPNRQPFDVMNPLLNPGDDPTLREVDRLTITKYYDPGLKTPNPQSGRPLAFTPYEAVMLQAGMHIYGATTTGTASDKRLVVMPSIFFDGDGQGEEGQRVGTYGAGNWPFGVFQTGAQVGHCVYALTEMLGWDSTQFTQMPAASGMPNCTYPEVDYEIVHLGDKRLCASEFKLLDPVQDWDNYTRYGFVAGSGDAAKDARCLKVEPFSAKKMSLTERNVPDAWKGPRPNAVRYAAAGGADTTRCPYDYDTVVTPYVDSHGGGVNPLPSPATPALG